MQSYIKFANRTLAQKAQRLLLSHGVRSIIRRNPSPRPREGCTFALFVQGDPEAALRLLAHAGIPNLGAEDLRDGR